MDRQLEAFKCEINLTEYAAGQGYRLDRRASSRNSAVMRRESDGDKVVIARGHDAHWIYFSVRDFADNGSILDFVMHRERCSLGGARQALMRWTGSGARAGGGAGAPRPHPDLFASELEPVSKDRAQVIVQLQRMKPLAFHAYLEAERAIPRALLTSPRFAGKLRIDARMNAVFPHADQDGPCGYEIKNRAFTGFSRGGDKGLWVSAVRAGDTALVIAESGIDALSYAALHPEEGTRYASTGGALNPAQPALIAAAMQRIGQGGRIVLAMDNDPAGRGMAQTLVELVAQTGRSDLQVVQALPEPEGADWNDVLRGGAGSVERNPERTK